MRIIPVFCLLTILETGFGAVSRFHLSLVLSGEQVTEFNSSVYKYIHHQPAQEEDLQMAADDMEWREFKEKYKKNYISQGEDAERRRIYFENKEKIEKHNRRAKDGDETYVKAINQFADMTQEQFLDFLKASGDPTVDVPIDNPPTEEELSSLPSSFNWKSRGGIVDVKNQGSCGSCWTFAAAGALETLHYVKTKNLISLSEQQILDCSSNRKYGNYGCHGGYPTKALQYIVDAGGIFREDQYPYLGYQSYCRIYKRPDAANCRGFVRAKPGNENHMAYYIALNGTMSVLVNAADWQYYGSGVYNHPNCKYGGLNHAVLLVGYTPEYWIVKNSWGKGWGEQGYIRMTRNSNMCGIANQAIIPY